MKSSNFNFGLGKMSQSSCWVEMLRLWRNVSWIYFSVVLVQLLVQYSWLAGHLSHLSCSPSWHSCCRLSRFAFWLETFGMESVHVWCTYCRRNAQDTALVWRREIFVVNLARLQVVDELNFGSLIDHHRLLLFSGLNLPKIKSAYSKNRSFPWFNFFLFWGIWINIFLLNPMASNFFSCRQKFFVCWNKSIFFILQLHFWVIWLNYRSVLAHWCLRCFSSPFSRILLISGVFFFLSCHVKNAYLLSKVVYISFWNKNTSLFAWN